MFGPDGTTFDPAAELRVPVELTETGANAFLAVIDSADGSSEIAPSRLDGSELIIEVSHFTRVRVLTQRDLIQLEPSDPVAVGSSFDVLFDSRLETEGGAPRNIFTWTKATSTLAVVTVDLGIPRFRCDGVGKWAISLDGVVATPLQEHFGLNTIKLPVSTVAFVHCLEPPLDPIVEPGSFIFYENHPQQTRADVDFFPGRSAVEASARAAGDFFLGLIFDPSCDGQVENGEIRFPPILMQPDASGGASGVLPIDLLGCHIPFITPFDEGFMPEVFVGAIITPQLGLQDVGGFRIGAEDTGSVTDANGLRVGRHRHRWAHRARDFLLLPVTPYLRRPQQSTRHHSSDLAAFGPLSALSVGSSSTAMEGSAGCDSGSRRTNRTRPGKTCWPCGGRPTPMRRSNQRGSSTISIRSSPTRRARA